MWKQFLVLQGMHFLSNAKIITAGHKKIFFHIFPHVKMSLTLAASEYEKFTSFIGAIKIKSSQRCLTTSTVDGKATNGLSWFKSTWKTKKIIKET